MKDEIKKFIRFCMVGGIGFITDAGILQIGISFFDLGPMVARVPSFLIAVLVTWYLHRGFTFRAHGKSFLKSFPIYISSNSLGLGINLGIYFGGIILIPALADYPLIPLSIGAAFALFFNFFASRWIFHKED